MATWLVSKNLKPAADRWCALCEFEAWGRDAAEFAYVPDAAFAAQLRQDPLVAKAMAAMMGFQRASWEQGVAGQALLEAGERDAAIALARASLIYVNQNGVVAALNGSTTDPLMLGDCLWWSARTTRDAELVKAADNMLQFALQGAFHATDGTPFHQASSQEMWADGSFTTPPFLAAAGHPDEAIAQLLGVHRRLWDAEKKLMHHRWSEKKQALVGPAFWGGGNGWTAAAFARVIRSLPANRTAEREQLATMLKELLDGCLAHQRTDGLFYNNVDEPSSFVETDLAAMLAYAIYESVRGGWLPESYLARADQMRAAVRAKVDRFGFVQGVAGAPRFDRAGISAEGQAFFILMEAAAHKAGRHLRRLRFNTHRDFQNANALTAVIIQQRPGPLLVNRQLAGHQRFHVVRAMRPVSAAVAPQPLRHGAGITVQLDHADDGDLVFHCPGLFEVAGQPVEHQKVGGPDAFACNEGAQDSGGQREMFRFEQDAFLQHPAKKPDFFRRERPRSVTGHNGPEVRAEIKMMAAPVPERDLFQLVTQWRLAGASGPQEQNGFKFHAFFQTKIPSPPAPSPLGRGEGVDGSVRLRLCRCPARAVPGPGLAGPCV